MKKGFLFSLLGICMINSALAEHIKNLDTSVGWSAIALHKTVSQFHPNPEHYIDIVGDYAINSIIRVHIHHRMKSAAAFSRRFALASR